MATKAFLKTTFPGIEGILLTKDNMSPNADGSNVLTCRDVLIISVTSEFEDDQKNPDQIQEKLSRFVIYQKLLSTNKDTDELVFQDDEAMRIRPRIARQFSVLVAGPMLQMLNQPV